VTIHRKPHPRGDCHEERRPRSFIASGAWLDQVDAEVVAQRRPTALNGVEPQVSGTKWRSDLRVCASDLFSSWEEVTKGTGCARRESASAAAAPGRLPGLPMSEGAGSTSAGRSPENSISPAIARSRQVRKLPSGSATSPRSSPRGSRRGVRSRNLEAGRAPALERPGTGRKSSRLLEPEGCDCCRGRPT
jgi:hypothetical protein